MPADYYRNANSGSIHRRGCKHASARHAKPHKEWDGWSVSDLVDWAEKESSLNFLTLSQCCFTAEEDILRRNRLIHTSIRQLGRDF